MRARVFLDLPLLPVQPQLLILSPLSDPRDTNYIWFPNSSGTVIFQWLLLLLHITSFASSLVSNFIALPGHSSGATWSWDLFWPHSKTSLVSWAFRGPHTDQPAWSLLSGLSWLWASWHQAASCFVYLCKIVPSIKHATNPKPDMLRTDQTFVERTSADEISYWPTPWL